jgi:ADP-ribose pyrophosphatase YjhB (NUDIX family)
MNSSRGGFIIRVYGLILNENMEVLVSDEYQMNMNMTKFPGGGLHYGEGLRDCLTREIREECNGQELKNIRHFYTTDFYQEALFYRNRQLISIYFLAEFSGPVKFRISSVPFDFDQTAEGSQSFRWIGLNDLNIEDLSFPVDKIVAALLKNTKITW